MSFIYERTINYYETDKMGVVHHSNYIRFLEEARCYYLENENMPFISFEDRNITIPVLGINCQYKHHVTFGDTLLISVFVKSYNGVRLTMGYDVIDKKTGKVAIIAETQHCFTTKSLKPVNLKKVWKDCSDKFEKLLKS